MLLLRDDAGGMQLQGEQPKMKPRQKQKEESFVCLVPLASPVATHCCDGYKMKSGANIVCS